MVTLETSSGVRVCGLMLACHGEGDFCPRASGGIWMSVPSIPTAAKFATIEVVVSPHHQGIISRSPGSRF